MSERNIHVRRAQLSDAQTVADAEALFIDCPWTVEQVRAEISKPAALFFVAESEDGRFAGYLFGDVALDECELGNIAVMPDFRRQGVGVMLFEAFVRAAKSLGIKTLFLLVREDNVPAIGLYNKIGFMAVGTRPRYYKGHKAIIMRLNLM